MLRTATMRMAPLVRRTAVTTSRRTFATFYTNDHEYAKVEGTTATCGISDHAQSQMGDVVYVSLPEVGDEFSRGHTAASVESVKAASDMYAPVSGTVTEVNEALLDDPEIINNDAEDAGWFFKVEMSDASETDDLMGEDEYAKFVEEEDH